jgi:hypothetical protein
VLRLLLGLVIGVAAGFGGGWAVFDQNVFSGKPSRHDVEQAVLESGYGDPLSASCRRLAGSDHIWTCSAEFPDNCSHDYRVVAAGGGVRVSPVTQSGFAQKLEAATGC